MPTALSRFRLLDLSRQLPGPFCSMLLADLGMDVLTVYAPNDPMLVSKLQQKGVQITARPQSDNTPWFIALLVNALPFVLFIGAWVFLSRQMQSGAGRATTS